MDLDPRLTEALADSQRLGMLGDRPIDEVITHALAFVDALADVTGSVVDLGSGGGVPGLVVAVARPDLDLLLVDRRTKRTDHLRRLVRRLDLSERVQVRDDDVGVLVAERPSTFDAAIARGFGPPDFTLRTGVDLVVPGGRVVISEPPEGDRWDPAEVSDLGARRIDAPAGVASFVVLRATR